MQDHTPGAYGATPAISPKTVLRERRRISIYGVGACFLVPLLVFCAVFAAASLGNSVSLTVVVLLAVALIVAVLCLTYSAVQRSRRGDQTALREPAWYILLSLSVILAFFLGGLLGGWNWSTNTFFYSNYLHLRDYSSVDPSTMSGKQLQDAGKVYFVNQSFVDLRRAMGLGSSKVYCVAPIATGSATLATYDFWAVGVNCCTASGSDFTCGESGNSAAHAGLRLVKSKETGHFHVAVQKAQATYNIKVTQAIFFDWVQDPVTEHSNYLAESYKVFGAGVVAYAFFQLIFVAAACFLFHKIGMF